jgi:hypothetical protein
MRSGMGDERAGLHSAVAWEGVGEGEPEFGIAARGDETAWPAPSPSPPAIERLRLIGAAAPPPVGARTENGCVQTYAPPRPVGATARQLGGRRATGLARDIGGGFGDSALRHHQAMTHVGHFPADRDARISVTDRCNFGCSYCMPRASFGPGHAFMRRQETLTTNEIVHIGAVLVRLGMRKIRLTGGEPLLRGNLSASFPAWRRRCGPQGWRRRVTPCSPVSWPE